MSSAGSATLRNWPMAAAASTEEAPEQILSSFNALRTLFARVNLRWTTTAVETLTCSV